MGQWLRLPTPVGPTQVTRSRHVASSRREINGNHKLKGKIGGGLHGGHPRRIPSSSQLRPACEKANTADHQSSGMVALAASPRLPWQRRRLRGPPASCSSLRDMERRRSVAEGIVREAKRVVLVRHGQSTWNKEGRIQGSSDESVLTPKGESQADASRQMLLADSFDVCFTSPLARSKRTAEIIWGGRKEEIILDPDLREIDLYSFQGLLKNEGKERYGDAYRMWQVDAANFKIDGHYPVTELWDRAKSSWNKILAHQGKSVLVVAHNAVNQALVATAIGLGTEYFRRILQSNCGVSVIDFTPHPGAASPHICLNRLNQTPNSPIASGSSAGRKTNTRIILVCQGATQSNNEAVFPNMTYESMNMLGVIQSQKTAELLLDLKVNCIVCSPRIASVDTATVISEVQEAADCLGADCMPRYVEVKRMLDIEVEPILQQVRKDPMALLVLDGYHDGVIKELWNQSKKAWKSLLDELSTEPESEPQRNVVVVGHPAIHIALLCHCLNLPMKWMGSFHLDAGSISVLDFPDGPSGRGVIRCINYTAHLGRWSIPVTRTTMEEDEEFY